MTLPRFDLLAMPIPAPRNLPDQEECGAFAVRFTRPAGAARMRFNGAIDAGGEAIAARRVPRALRRLSSRGFIENRYGWFRQQLIPSFVDGTIYGSPRETRKTQSEHFILTRDFILHGHSDLQSAPVIRSVTVTRYGVQLYGLPADLRIMPVYLRRRIVAPRSAHESLTHIAELQPQLSAALGMLGIPAGRPPHLTWLPDHAYGHV